MEQSQQQEQLRDGGAGTAAMALRVCVDGKQLHSSLPSLPRHEAAVLPLSKGGNQWRRVDLAPELSSDEDEGSDNDGEGIDHDGVRVSSPVGVSGKSRLAAPELEPQRCIEDDRRDSIDDDNDDTEVSFRDADNDLQRRHDQLQDDVEVLVLHLQRQTQVLEDERAETQRAHQQLQHAKDAAERELQSVSIENAALRRQHALVVEERDQLALKAQTASETHEELLGALRTQQQRDEHARTIVTVLVKERDALKKQLDESKTYCRRLEEEALSNKAELQHLRSETKALQTAAKAVAGQKNDREAHIIAQQQQLIESLRADVLQMEFEFKTVTVDKERLAGKVATLLRQSEHRAYDVISLTSGGDAKGSKARKPPVKLTVITSNPSDNRHGSGDGFSNLMALPNYVGDDSLPGPVGGCGSGNGASVGTVATRARTPVGSLVSKTLSSAKKRLFHSSQNTVVIPQ